MLRRGHDGSVIHRLALSLPLLDIVVHDDVDDGEWMYANLAKAVVLSASDFGGGRDIIGEFKAGFVKHGGSIIKEIYPPLGNNDFSPYLADIRSAGAKASFNFYAGTDAVRFVRQYDEFGLRSNCQLTGSGFMLEGDTLPAQSVLLWVQSMRCTMPTLDNAANKKFVADYQARYKDFPNVYAEYGYVAARVLHAAIEATDGNTVTRRNYARRCAR